MRTSRAGFTVVELMIALTCGGIAISSMYVIGAASMRTFRAQERIATTQSSLRSAMAQVKRDFQRAGFLGTPNVDQQGESCMDPPITAPVNDSGTTFHRGRLAAISAYHPNVTAATGGFTDLDPDKLNAWNRLDDVILTGNYATSGEYMGLLMAPNRTTLTVPFTTQGFARDFTHWYAAGGAAAGACNEGALKTAFAKGRLLRVHTLSELNAFVSIKDATCDATNGVAQIEAEVALPRQCNATGGWLSPLSVIRYWVKNAVGLAASRSGSNRVAILHRTEVDPSAKDKELKLADGSIIDDRMVLDYVVHFRVDFLMRETGVNTINFAPATQAEVQANPEQVRGAIIELGARTSEHEPDMDVTGLNAPFPPFRVYDTRGAARTRVLKAELLLPNIAHKGR